MTHPPDLCRCSQARPKHTPQDSIPQTGDNEGVTTNSALCKALAGLRENCDSPAFNRPTARKERPRVDEPGHRPEGCSLCWSELRQRTGGHHLVGGTLASSTPSPHSPIRTCSAGSGLHRARCGRPASKASPDPEHPSWNTGKDRVSSCDGQIRGLACKPCRQSRALPQRLPLHTLTLNQGFSGCSYRIEN